MGGGCTDCWSLKVAHTEGVGGGGGCRSCWSPDATNGVNVDGAVHMTDHQEFQVLREWVGALLESICSLMLIYQIFALLMIEWFASSAPS